jgi:hypothetical protein
MKKSLNASSGRTAGQRRLHHGARLRQRERQQNAVDTLRVRIHRHDRLRPYVLRRVRDQTVLSDRHDQVALTEDVRRQQRAIQKLARQPQLQVAMQARQRALVRLVLPLVCAEIAARVLDVEPRLPPRIEPLDQLLEPRPPRHHDQLLVHRVTSPAARPAATSADRA